MPDKYDHLVLPIIPHEYQRSIRGGGGYKKFSRNKEVFYTTEIQTFSELERSIKVQKNAL